MYFDIFVSLQKLYDEYKQKLEGEGKKVKTGGGFHGKGFKFDESEANFASEKKKFEKAALGLADSDDEDIEHDIDQQIESMLNTKRTVKEIKVLYMKARVANVGVVCIVDKNWKLNTILFPYDTVLLGD